MWHTSVIIVLCLIKTSFEFLHIPDKQWSEVPLLIPAEVSFEPETEIIRAQWLPPFGPGPAHIILIRIVVLLRHRVDHVVVDGLDDRILFTWSVVFSGHTSDFVKDRGHEGADAQDREEGVD